MSDEDSAKPFADALKNGWVVPKEYVDARGEIERLRAERDEARAELAAERERANILDIAFCDIADEMGIEPDNEGMLIWVDGIKSEHNRLRALLREARDHICSTTGSCSLTFRIDAALKGDVDGRD